MVEKAKAGKGASVAKTGTISNPPSKSEAKNQWDSSAAQTELAPREVCQDNSPEPAPSAAATSSRAKKPAPKQAIGEQLGRQLRSVYNDVLAQPVPDRFLDLLSELEKDPK